MSVDQPEPAANPAPRQALGGVPPLLVVVIALVAGLVGFTIGSLTSEDDAVAVAVADSDADVEDTAGLLDALEGDPDGAANGATEPAGGEPAGDEPAGDEPAGDVQAQEDPGASAGADPSGLPDAEPATRPTLGAADAPVVMEIYSDFACPFCVRHDLEVEPELIERYVEPGLLRLVWFDTPFQGQRALQLAVAARAGQRQDAFWEVKEAIFAEGPSGSSLEELVALAESRGLDGQRFAQDLEDPELVRIVQSDLQRSQQLQVQGTPTFLINGERIVGAQALPTFLSVIDIALEQA